MSMKKKVLIFFNEKKIRKIPIIFDIENWLWKSNFGLFDSLPLQFSKFGNYSWFVAKNLSNFVSLSWKLHNRYCHDLSAIANPGEANEDDINIDADDAQDTSDAPTKCVQQTLSLNIKAQIQFIDFEGRSDGESVMKLIQQVCKFGN